MSENNGDQASAGPADDHPSAAPATSSMEEAIAAIHEQREAVEHIRATKVKLYGLLQRNDLDESILGPTLVELDENFRNLHPDAIRNEDSRQKFDQQVESVLQKGMEIMHIFNNEFRTLKDLEPYRQQWYEEDQKRKWAQLLQKKTPKGKGKGKGKNTQQTPQPSASGAEREEARISPAEEDGAGAQNHTTRSTHSVRNNRTTNSPSQQKRNQHLGENVEYSDSLASDESDDSGISGSM